MTPFSCGQCGQTVFFENTACGACGATLGFLPGELRLVAFASLPPGPGPWLACGSHDGQWLQPCANRVQYGACNWLLDAGDTLALCRSCRLTQTLPPLAEPGNLDRWRVFEQAKRRLVYTLISLGLPPQPKAQADDFAGLAFRLLATLPGDGQVLTGHDDGVITVNIDECDDVQRETTRVAMGEPVRTLLGHLRHETAHYLQYRYIDGTPAQARCREVFGDESAGYAAALQRHYDNGPPANWQTHHVSPYASAHPWEDWAETCAHYLLVVDAVQVVAAWGLALSGPAAAVPMAPDQVNAAPIGELVLQQWLPVARFLNAMNRSLGLRDSYPFQLSDVVLAKMGTVQEMLQQARRAETPQAAADPVPRPAPQRTPQPATHPATLPAAQAAPSTQEATA